MVTNPSLYDTSSWIFCIHGLSSTATPTTKQWRSDTIDTILTSKTITKQECGCTDRAQCGLLLLLLIVYMVCERKNLRRVRERGRDDSAEQLVVRWIFHPLVSPSPGYTLFVCVQRKDLRWMGEHKPNYVYGPSALPFAIFQTPSFPLSPVHCPDAITQK